MKIELKESEIVPVMIGTAGHVDHGKTSLVKLLTGCDTDRLKEEKERGLSIDLGFAPCALAGNKTVGIIDVPGHLDFIRNMVAGATSMDILMLVIAADDSIMPQTKEHLQIVKLLRAPQLMIVVTKTDLVDAEMLELVMEEVKEFGQETGYSDVSILPVSNVTLDGISNVRKEIERLVSLVLNRNVEQASSLLNNNGQDARTTLNVEHASSLLNNIGQDARTTLNVEQASSLFNNNGQDARTTLNVEQASSLLNNIGQNARTTLYDKRAFRMNIERVFSIKGYGTVVTGIPTSGEISIDDKVILYPSEKESRVRAIQNYKQQAKRTGANYCTAINLVDVSKNDVKRGMTLSLPQGNYQTSKFILAEIHNVDTKYKIKQNTEVRIHYGTANVLGKISLVYDKELKSGEKGFAKIRVREPIFLVAGDKFIIRQLSPSITIGGGTVLNISQQKIKKNLLHLNEAMSAFEKKDYFMMELLSLPNFLYTKNELINLTHFNNIDDSETEINLKLHSKEIIDLGKDAYLINTKLAVAAEHLKKQLARFHIAKPATWGLDAAEFANIYKVKKENFAEFAKQLSKFDEEICFSYQRLALSSFEPSISKTEFLLLEKIVAKLAKGGIAAPAIGDLLTEFKTNKKDFNKLIKILSEENKIITIGKNILLKEVFDNCKIKMLKYYNHNEYLEIADFRELTGASRNFSVSLLEKFDSLGITKKTDNGRILLTKKEDL